jgi:hypothetical protein
MPLSIVGFLSGLLLVLSTYAASCPRGQSLHVSIASGLATLSNGFVCIELTPGKLHAAYGDWDGQGNYGSNVLASGGMTLQRQAIDGQVFSSASLLAGDVSVRVVANSSSTVAVEMSGIADSISNPVGVETWEISLHPNSRVFNFSISGKVVASTSIASLRHQWEFAPSSVYAWFRGGVVQMKNADSDAGVYASSDVLNRVYALGGSGSEKGQVGNMSIELLFESSLRPAATYNQTAILSQGKGTYLSGLQELLVGDFGVDLTVLDHWTNGSGLVGVTTVPTRAWNYTVVIGVNNRDFPVAKVPAFDGLLSLDSQAMLTGIFASPVGCLCTHLNEVSEGIAVGQIATTIARPDRGYAGTYNYFDPDNYISTAAMLWSNEPYLQSEVLKVLLRSGAYLLPSGQLPHHFSGTTPIYQALSGEIQTGPNVFWILSCFNYAKSTQNSAWLASYLPTLRLASNFLFALIDPVYQLASVPGSLMIDVFIRNNMTTDTNAMLVGFFNEFADAEEIVGNATGAASLRSLAIAIAAGVNQYLWADPSRGGDHYITQWDPVSNTTRDFIDYDANLIACAHGIPDPERMTKVLARIDSGRCRAGVTFVAEDYYGPDDTTNGNIGDSWCAMARIAWFEALSRQRLQDAAGFNELIMEPLKQALLSTTWMHERLACDGTQQLNRTEAYFEYPAAVAMLLRSVRYGISLGFASVTVAPLGVAAFTYDLGNVFVAYDSPRSVAVNTPVWTATGGPMKYVFAGLSPGSKYQFVLSNDLAHATAVCAFPGISGSAMAGTDGKLTATITVGANCLVTCSLV